MTTAVEKAFNHVKEHFEELSMVVFDKEGKWCYMDTNFEPFIFGEDINQELLEEASDSLITLPYIYQPII